MTQTDGKSSGYTKSPGVDALPTDRSTLISVIVPTYQPTAFLEDALQSVLRQDLGAAQMQILVYDDASPTIDIEPLVRRADPDRRIELHRAAHNLGLAGHWNRCLEICTGKYVHFLHQDDRVFDGFYHRMLGALEKHPRVGLAFCRHSYIDGADEVTYRSRRERLTAGILRNWLPRIAEKQRIQCVAAIVRREAFQKLGGFYPQLKFALDWEMWVRIASQFDIWFDPALLAAYRQHAASETTRLKRQGEIEADLLRTIETFKQCLPAERRDDLSSRAYATFARRALKRLERDKGLSTEQTEQLLEHIAIAIHNMTALPRQAAKFRRLSASYRRTPSPSR